MITRHTYTHTYEHAGQRVREDVTSWRLMGVVPLYTQRREVWRRTTTMSDELRVAVLRADADQCVYCGCADRTQLTIDHLTPQHAGGLSLPENLRAACVKRNSTKNNCMPEEAGMPLVYGRYRPPPTHTLAERPRPPTPGEARILAQFRSGRSLHEVVVDVSGQPNTGHRIYKKQRQRIEALLREALTNG